MLAATASPASMNAYVVGSGTVDCRFCVSTMCRQPPPNAEGSRNSKVISITATLPRWQRHSRMRPH